VTSTSGGTVGGLTVGDTFTSSIFSLSAKNIGGTAGVLAGTYATSTNHDTSQVGNSCAVNNTGANATFTCTTISTNGEVRWTIEATRVDCN
jgi:hypothetical protein